MTTAFDAELGTAQGRIQPLHWTAAEGTWIYQLGHDVPGTVRNVGAGDLHQTAQSFNIDNNYSFVRNVLHVRPPALALPAGVYWVVEGRIDSAVMWSVELRAGERERTLTDLAIPTRNYRGASHPVSFRLRLAGPAGRYDVELPGVYIDQVVPDTSATTPRLVLRSPEPNDTGVPATTSIQVGLSDPSGAGLGAISIYVNGALVLTATGSTILTTGAGYSSASSTPDSTTSVFLLDPAGSFPALSFVQVRVVAVVGASTLDESYSFRIADTLAPVLVEAIAIDERTLRVTFDESVRQHGDGDASDALTPGAYAIELVSGAPAVTPEVITATSNGASQVLLGLDRIMTRGAVYRLIASGIVDVVGNVIAAPNDRAEFVGYLWPVPAGRRTNLFEMLPEKNQAEDTTGEHRRFLGILQEPIDILFGQADRAPQIWDPDLAPEPLVDLMLVDLGNPFDFLDLTEIEKRRLVQTLLAIYRSKGTGPGIVAATQFFLGLTVSIRVFAWSPVGLDEAILEQTWVLGSSEQRDLYTFEVLAPELTDEQWLKLDAIVDYMKVAHEHHRIVEPTPVLVPDHWQLGYSLLGTQTFLH